MIKQFNYSRPKLILFGYFMSVINFSFIFFFIGTNPIPLPIFFICIGPFLTIVLLEKIIWKKCKVTILDSKINISNPGKPMESIAFHKIESTSIKYSGVSRDLLIKYKMYGEKYGKIILSGLRFSNKDLDEIKSIVTEIQSVKM